MDLTFSWTWSRSSGDFTTVANPLVNYEDIWYDRIWPPENLCLYMDMRDIHTIDEHNEWNDNPAENPFNFVIRTGSYEQIPHPENCTTLHTPYNIKTDGVVMAQNIETYAYTLNATATELNGLVNEVRSFEMWVEMELSDIIKDLQSLESSVAGLNAMVWMDIGITIISGLVSGGVSLIAGIGELATKVAVDATKGAIELDAKGLADAIVIDTNLIQKFQFKALPVYLPKVLLTVN
jgi:hypothetical protein